MNLSSIHVTTAILPPRILIHGQEGVGKTTLAAKFPAPVFLQTEDGCPAGLSLNTFGPLTGFQDLRAAIAALASEPHQYRTIILDSVDAAEPMIWQDVCKTQNWATIESPGYGKGFTVLDSWWIDLLKGFEYLRRARGMIIVMIAHSAIETINDPRAAPYTSYQIRLHKRARSLVQDWADAIAFLAPDLNVIEQDAGFGRKRARADGGATRWLHWESRPSFTAKNRYALPAKMSISQDFSYEALASYFPPPPADVSTANPQTST